MKIVMASSEIKPFSSTGGLGEVVYSLSKELAKLDNELILISPLYSTAKESLKRRNVKLKKICEIETRMSWRLQKGKVYECKYEGLKFYFVSNDYYFNRAQIYGYGDDGERFAYFCLAVKEICIHLNISPDILHVHDWQTAFIPVLVKEDRENWEKFFDDTKFILTIHNPAFKGYLDPYFLSNFFNLPDNIFYDGKVRLDDQVSTLKAGIIYSDKVTTVSPTHKNELLYDVFGFGLSGALKIKGGSFVGIKNGINTEGYSPEHDSKIAANYGLIDVNEGKAKCKKALFKNIKHKNNNVPVFGLVSRLTDQKGIKILIPSIRERLEMGDVFAIVGNGDYCYEKELEILKNEYPTQVFLFIGYDDDKARQVFSASDFFLMPSFFEPCGIGQMMAQRYGTIPIARRTGGLADSIDDYSEYGIKSNGILFTDFDKNAVDYGFETAIEIFENKSILTKIRKNCLETDNSWTKSAKLYLHLYRSAIK